MGKPSLIPIVDAGYSLDGDEPTWLAALTATTAAALGEDLGVLGFAFDARGFLDGRKPALTHSVSFGGPPDLEEITLRGLSRTAGEGSKDPTQELLFHSGVPLVHGATDLAEGALWDDLRELGAADFIALRATSLERIGVTLLIPTRERLQLSSRRRESLERVAVHLGAAYRLRRRLATPSAAGSSGTVHHHPLINALVEAGAELASAELLREQTGAKNRLRALASAFDSDASSSETPDADVLNDWRALVEGRVSLVDTFERAGRRYVIALDAATEHSDPRALSEIERAVAGYAALGYSNQLIAYSLELGPSTVAGLLQRVLTKLGLEHRAQLALLATGNAL